MTKVQEFTECTKDSDSISNWCKEYGIVNNQPEIKRAGELIEILMDKEEDSVRQIAEYSDELRKLSEQWASTNMAFMGLVEALTGDKSAKALAVGLAKSARELRGEVKDLKEKIDILEMNNKKLKEKLNNALEKANTFA